MAITQSTATTMPTAILPAAPAAPPVPVAPAAPAPVATLPAVSTPGSGLMRGLAADAGIAAGVDSAGIENLGALVDAGLKVEQLKDIQINRWGTLGKEIAGLGIEIVKAVLAFKAANLEEDKLDLLKTKESHSYDLQGKIIEKTDLQNERAVELARDTKRIESNTEIAKARISGEVAKAKIKTNGLRDIFFGRREHYYG